MIKCSLGLNTYLPWLAFSWFFPYYCFRFLCISMSLTWPAWLTAMVRWLAYYTHYFISKSCFLNTFLAMKTKKPKLNWYNEDNSSWHRFSIVTLWDVSHVLFIREQGAKKVIFTACHSGKLNLAFTSPNVISTSPPNFLMGRIDFIVLL